MDRMVKLAAVAASALALALSACAVDLDLGGDFACETDEECTPESAPANEDETRIDAGYAAPPGATPRPDAGVVPAAPDAAAEEDTGAIDPTPWCNRVASASWRRVDRGDLPARAAHSAAVDPISGDMLVFGGTNATADFLTIHLAPLAPAVGFLVAPFFEAVPRAHHAATLDDASLPMRVMIFGGEDSAGALVDDTWELFMSPPSAWQQIDSPRPAARTGASLTAYADGTDRWMIAFGGRTAAGATNQLLRWSLDFDDGWTLETIAGAPEPRWGHSAVYVPARGSMIIFGGRDANRAFDDAWELTLATRRWRQLSWPGESPSARHAHSAIWDPTAGRMIVYGGADAALLATNTNTTWALGFDTNSDACWTELTPTASGPAARREHTGTLRAGKMIVYGGIGNNESALRDLWELTPAY